MRYHHSGNTNWSNSAIFLPVYYCTVEYVGTDYFGPNTVPHGNSKTTNPYKRTNPYMLEEAKEKIKKGKVNVQEVLSELSEGASGSTKLPSAKSISNLKTTIAIEEKEKAINHSRAYIKKREKVYKDFVTSTDKGLNFDEADLQEFCETMKNEQMLSFNSAKFHLSCIQYGYQRDTGIDFKAFFPNINEYLKVIYDES